MIVLSIFTVILCLVWWRHRKVMISKRSSLVVNTKREKDGLLPIAWAPTTSTPTVNMEPVGLSQVPAPAELLPEKEECIRSVNVMVGKKLFRIDELRVGPKKIVVKQPINGQGRPRGVSMTVPGPYESVLRRLTRSAA